MKFLPSLLILCLFSPESLAWPPDRIAGFQNLFPEERAAQRALNASLLHEGFSDFLLTEFSDDATVQRQAASDLTANRAAKKAARSDVFMANDMLAAVPSFLYEELKPRLKVVLAKDIDDGWEQAAMSVITAARSALEVVGEDELETELAKLRQRALKELSLTEQELDKRTDPFWQQELANVFWDSVYTRVRLLAEDYEKRVREAGAVSAMDMYGSYLLSDLAAFYESPYGRGDEHPRAVRALRRMDLAVRNVTMKGLGLAAPTKESR